MDEAAQRMTDTKGGLISRDTKPPDITTAELRIKLSLQVSLRTCPCYWASPQLRYTFSSNVVSDISSFAMDFDTSLLVDEVWDARRDSRHEPSITNIPLHYERAKALCLSRGLTVDDIAELTPRFWDFHFDPISSRDMTAFVIATIHLNLCVGTIARFSRERPDLMATLEELLAFKACGEFMLTEVGHGLDARNLETTATMEADGSFTLNTPNAGAAKAMPPSSPLAGMARVAVVFARLIVGGNDRGVKPFVVRINHARG
ncbi:hypothetical protein CNYM01_14322, partial [Colletotrichum nymphaeae SA-01]